MKSPSEIIVILGFLLSNHFMSAQLERKQAQSLFAIGQQRYDEGKYQTAADSLEKASALFEKSKDITGQVKSLNLLGDCKATLNQCEEAIHILNGSLKLVQANFKPQSKEVADVYYYLARAVGGCSRKQEEGIALLRKSMKLRRKLYGESPEVAFDYTTMGYFLTNLGLHDSSSYYLEKALDIRAKHLPPDNVELANTLYNLGRNYENKFEMGKALSFHTRALKIRSAKLPPGHDALSSSLHQIGSAYQKLGNFDRAMDYCNRALAISIQSFGPVHTNVAANYLTIGNLYGFMFNYPQAIRYIKEGNSILEKLYGDKSDILPTYIAYLGRLHGFLGENVEALQAFKKAQTQAEKNLGPDHAYLGIVYSIIGDYYAVANQSVLASEYCSKAINIFRKATGPNSVREADMLGRIGSMHMANKNFKEAFKNYGWALSIYKLKMGDKNSKISSLYQLIGDAYQTEQQFPLALLNYQKAFISVSTGFTDTLNLLSNPTLEQLDNKPMALRIAGKKANALKLSAKSNEAISQKKNSLRSYLYAIDLIDDIAKGHEMENSRAELEKESRTIYNNGIDLAYSIFEKTKDRKFIQDAFFISEKSKAAMLMENIRDTQAKTRAGVPDSLVEKERDFKIELAFLQSSLHNALNKKDTASLALHEKNIFEVQQRYTKLKKDLSQTFPNYYKLRYTSTNPSLSKIQKELTDDATALIEFYVSDSSLYKFSITQQSFELEKIDYDGALNKLMDDYEKSLTDADFILNSKNEADQLFGSTSHRLYEILIKSSLEGDQAPFTKLIIVPDDRLAQFSFGTLISNRPQENNFNYQTLNYLGKHCKINYAYSSSLIFDNPLAGKKSISPFAGFAPSYASNQFAGLDSIEHPMAQLVVRNGKLPLPGALGEVKAISQFMDGDSWIDEAATETNFKLNAVRYNILHLAMHSLLNNEQPAYSELLFNHEKDTENDGYLNVTEIYNLRLNAAMIVLSACSSGFGKIQQGEGPISISRAFSYAGCPSVVMSLWKIPDDATSQVMTNFYKELKKGKAKDEAMRLAQLKFLQETNDPLYHHPYFWGSFVVMGNASPIEAKFSVWIIYSGIALGIIILVLFFLRRNRIKRISQVAPTVGGQHLV